ncbi:MAG: HelD family protein [Nostocoides sp.]
MTTIDPRREPAVADLVSAEIATEQAHVDRVYAELDKATARADAVAADGMARGRAQRSGDLREEDLTGLFERDALVFAAARRRHAIDNQYEGLVFGRLDLDDSTPADPLDVVPHVSRALYIGRLGVRDDDYEPLVIDWRAPAAAPFYRATPVQPLGVVRRRVLRCRGDRVVGVEDDLMVPQAPVDMVILGDGALMAALTRSRGPQMRDIVATIQAHQDEAIRADWRGVTEISGGPGTGKTVVALHRAAYLLYSQRRRFETGGVLVVGPSAAYTAYIERVLPSLGEESVFLRALGDVVDGVTATRLDTPEVAMIKGSTSMRRVLARLATQAPPEAPGVFRAFLGGRPVRLEESALAAVRQSVLKAHPHNKGINAARAALADAAWSAAGDAFGSREDFVDAWESSMEADAFVSSWWPQVDPREALLRLADTDAAYAICHGVLNHDEAAALAQSYRDALDVGVWSVADAALIDELSAILGPVIEPEPEEVGFYDMEAWDDSGSGVSPTGGQDTTAAPEAGVSPASPKARLLRGRIEPPHTYAHVLVDEAQDLSPMQWRMVGRRGRGASWTVVGDAAQSSWGGSVTEAIAARDAAYGPAPRRAFHMPTNYRNAREIFDYARERILPVVPDADIPDAVRETGVNPQVLSFVPGPAVFESVRAAVADLLGKVEGPVAVITPARYAALVSELDGWAGRVVVSDPISTKGLEYDATVVIDPDLIVEGSPGGARALYVALTRAAHRMTVLVPN